MMKMRIFHTVGFGSITGTYVPFPSAELDLVTFLYLVYLVLLILLAFAHWQVRGDDADDPTTYLVAFGETEAHYMVKNWVLTCKFYVV